MRRCLTPAPLSPAALDQWEREAQLFTRLKRLQLFGKHRLWKPMASWRMSVREAKVAAASRALATGLFTLSPTFQGPLLRLHRLCSELLAQKLHCLQPGQVRGWLAGWLHADTECDVATGSSTPRAVAYAAAQGLPINACLLLHSVPLRAQHAACSAPHAIWSH